MTGDGGILDAPLPPGRQIELPGRGTTFVRELDGPSEYAPTLILLHGWTASSDLNWFRAYGPLAKHYNVVAIDHRGHGGGIRSRRVFRLGDCADDAVALADVLGIERFVPVGYSMGGPIAQLIWKQHSERVIGLVLCATSSSFASSREERLSFLGLTGLAALARVTPAQARQRLTDQFYLQRKSADWEPWAIEEVARHEWRTVLEAGRSIGAFNSTEWIRDVDVPTSVIITMNDHVVPVRRQIRLFESIRGAEAFQIDGDHDACIAESETFNPLLVRAIHSVCERAGVLG